MVLIETTTVPAANLPLQVLKDHLRLGSGFSDDSLQDGVLENVLRAAMAAVETRTGKIVLERSFTWTLTGWRDRDSQALPVAPVQNITELRLVDRDGTADIVDPSLFDLQKDAQRPRLVARGALLPMIAAGGTAEIDFVAGYSAVWGGLPPDLGQAVILLAGHFYEHRDMAVADTQGFPMAVSGLLDPYRTVRIIGGDRV